MTTFGDGVYQYGGMPVGGGTGMAQFAGMWGTKVWFADHSHGANAHGGLKPTDAKKNVDKCIDEATAGDTIFVRPGDFSPTEEDPAFCRPDSTNGIVIPYNKYSMNIIGTSVGGIYGNYAVFFRGNASQAVTTPTMTVNAQNCVLENLSFDPRRGTASYPTDHLSKAQLFLHGAHSTASRGSMTTIYNCNFRRFAYHSAGSNAALVLEDAVSTAIIKCQFYRNQGSIAMLGSQDQIERVTVAGCEFVGTATHRDCDISMQGTGNRFINIYSNFFDVDPTNGDIDKYIYEASAVASTMVAGNYFNSAAAESAITRTLTENGLNWDQTGLVGI